MGPIISTDVDERKVTECPRVEAWQALLEGELPDDEIAVLGAHLDLCAACQRTVDVMNGRVTMTMTAAMSEPVPDDVRAVMDIALLTGDERTNRESTPCVELDEVRGLLQAVDDEEVLGLMGDYEVLDVIARGGMGWVLKARDPEMNRLVALKLLAPELAALAEARERFVREAQAAARLDDPHVLPIYRVVASGVIPYLVMPLNDGETLQDRWDREKRLAVSEVVRIGAAVARGLEAAHAAGLVHRDVKPANILLGADGQQVRLADFGLAQAVENTALTVTGALAGTPQFMAPEQIRGEDVDARADLFSLGVVLHGLLSGENPFAEVTLSGTLRKVTAKPAPSLTIETPKPLRNLVTSLLEKDPKARPQSAAEVVKLLGEATVSSRRPGVMSLAMAVGVGLVVVMGIVSWVSTPRTMDASFIVLEEAGETAYPTFAAAVLASRPGGTVLVSGNRISTETVRLPHALKIKAMPGRAPILVSQSVTGTVLESSHALALEGLTFEDVQAGGNAMPLVSANKASLTIRHCRFVRTADDGVEMTTRPALVSVADGDLTIAHSEFVGLTSRAVEVKSVDLDRTNQVRISHCLVAGIYGFVLSAQDQVEGKWEAYVSNTQWYCRSAILTNLMEPSRLEVKFQQNLVRGVGLIFSRTPWVTTRAALERGGWSGRGNVVDVSLVSTTNLGHKRPADQPDTFADWRELPMVVEESLSESTEHLPAASYLHDVQEAHRIERELGGFDTGVLRPSEDFVRLHPGVGPDFALLGPQG